jgi:molybdopterin-guanine dinucleotide biosynthesis protein A
MTRAGYVLTGGRSSRFGSDKARYEIDGRPLALRTAEKVRLAAGSVTLVGAPERYTDWDLRVIPDPVADFGPLAGIVAALEDAPAEWALIVALDMPDVTVSFLEYLLQTAESAEADVVLPIQPDGREQPLCAVYRTAAASLLRAQMKAGNAKIIRALEALRVLELQPHEYAEFGAQNLFRNLNHPEP